MASVSWEDLKAGIREAFSTDCVNVDDVKRLMNSYQSTKSDWINSAHFDPHTYTRNLVDEGNGKYNLIVLCWDTGQGSSIHDHADSHCFLKVLSGQIKETMYSWPDKADGAGSSSSTEKDIQPMSVTGSETLMADQVTYINNSIGLHRVENPSHTDQAVTLHLYCPPITTCKSFEERTGVCHCCKVTFYTVEGAKTPCNKK